MFVYILIFQIYITVAARLLAKESVIWTALQHNWQNPRQQHKSNFNLNK